MKLLANLIDFMVVLPNILILYKSWWRVNARVSGPSERGRKGSPRRAKEMAGGTSKCGNKRTSKKAAGLRDFAMRYRIEEGASRVAWRDGSISFIAGTASGRRLACRDRAKRHASGPCRLGRRSGRWFRGGLRQRDLRHGGRHRAGRRR